VQFAQENRITVIPAKAGIQKTSKKSHLRPWIPAFAGMTFSFWDMMTSNGDTC